MCSSDLDVTEATWLIQPSSDNVSIGRQAADGDVTIEGDAAALVRWFYGRADIMALEKQGRVRLQGARDHASSWHTIFPAP